MLLRLFLPWKYKCAVIRASYQAPPYPSPSPLLGPHHTPPAQSLITTITNAQYEDAETDILRRECCTACNGASNPPRIEYHEGESDIILEVGYGIEMFTSSRCI